MTENKASHLDCKDIATRWEQVEVRVGKAWRFSDDVLDLARPNLRERLFQLAAELDKHVVFSKMSPLGPCDFLWVLFLTDGAPGTAEWRKTWNDESGLRDLQLWDVYVVVAAIGMEIAAFALDDYDKLIGKAQDIQGAEKTELLTIADTSLGIAERALALAEAQVLQDARSDLY